MGMWLRQSTASQEVLLGRFVDATDGDTEETGLTIANTDIKLWKEGATTLANKNSGGATHIANGMYYAVLDATDTDTLGKLEVNVHVSGALSVRREFMVLPAMIYDSLVLGSDRFDVNVTHIGDTSQTARDIGASVLLSSGTGTGQLDFTSGVVKANVTQYGGSAGTFASGRPEVNATHITGSAVSTSSAQIGVNVVNAGGTAWGSGAITAASIASDAITAAKIADGAIDAATFATGAITAASIAADAITDAKVASDVTIASVTGAVGSVTGNVGGNVVGSVGSVVATVNADTIKISGNTAAADNAENYFDTAGFGHILQRTTIATLASQTSFTLTAGSADNDAYNDCVIVIEDSATAAQKAVGVIDDYTGSTKTVTLRTDPAVFTMAVNDIVSILADRSLKPTVMNRTLDVTATGAAGIDWANVENPTTTVGLSGTTVKTATDVETDTADIQSRLPAALVSGRIDASVGAYQTGLTPLQPTTAGRTLDVTAGGCAGIDWANVEAPTTTLALTGTTIATTQQVDVNTIKTQSVTCGAGVTVGAYVGQGTAAIGVNASGHVSRVVLVDTVTTLTGHTAQTGDSYARIGAAGAGLTDLGGMSTTMKAQVQTEAEEALQTYHLDHFIASADPGSVVANSSFLAKLTSKSATPAFSSYDNTTDSLEAVRDRGDAAWITATGFSTHTAADVWSAATRTLTAGTNIQLPSNGLANVTAWTVAITGNITGNLSGSVGSISTGGIAAASFAAGAIDAAAIATDAIGSAELSSAACNKIADHTRRRTQANVEASSDGDTLDLSSEYGFIQQAQESSVSGSTLTVKKTDGSTTLGTKTVTSSASADPMTGIS